MTYLISSNKQPRVLQISEFIKQLKEVKKCRVIKTGKKIEYYNVPAAFDIEVTSFYSKDVNGELLKNGIMYIWTLLYTVLSRQEEHGRSSYTCSG